MMVDVVLREQSGRGVIVPDSEKGTLKSGREARREILDVLELQTLEGMRRILLS